MHNTLVWVCCFLCLDVGKPAVAGKTPLHFAARTNNVAAIRCLLEVVPLFFQEPVRDMTNCQYSQLIPNSDTLTHAHANRLTH